MSKIKLCGLFREDDIKYANIVMPDYVGFVFAESTRKVTKEMAIEFKKNLNEKIMSVGVFVDATIKTIVDIAKSKSIDIIQLHGNENNIFIKKIKKLTKLPVIKAVIIKEANQDLSIYHDADYMLFDGGRGAGKTFDWKWIQNYSKPYFISGGINIYNIRDAIMLLHPYALDISSGIEESGIKNLDKMQRVVDAVREN